MISLEMSCIRIIVSQCLVSDHAADTMALSNLLLALKTPGVSTKIICD